MFVACGLGEVTTVGELNANKERRGGVCERGSKDGERG
jgi:hypothetical protein